MCSVFSLFHRRIRAFDLHVRAPTDVLPRLRNVAKACSAVGWTVTTGLATAIKNKVTRRPARRLLCLVFRFIRLRKIRRVSEKLTR